MKITLDIKTCKVLNIILDCASILLFAFAIWTIFIFLSALRNPPHAPKEAMERIVNTIDTSEDVDALRLEAQRLFCMNESTKEYYKNFPSPPINRFVSGYCLIVILKILFGRKLYKLTNEMKNSNQGMEPTRANDF